MKILDCTLRDGGYYTNWDFDESIVGLYFESMNKLPVDIIEFGYRSIPKDEYLGKYFYCPDFVLKQAKKMVPDKVLAIMLNEKDCEPDELETLLKPCRGIIQLVRIAVAPARIEKGIELAKAVKAKGFSVALNLMYVSTLSEQPEFFNKIKGIEAVVDYFNLVDSYGGIYPADVEKLVLQCKAKTKVTLGFHGHNNIELAFSNSLAAIKAGCEIVDATITGMGRGAGNLKTELMLTHLATKHHVNVDFNSLSNVTAAFSELQKKYEWGTNLPYMVSGANSLPQKEVMDWVTKRYYSINSIIRALENQKDGKKDNLKLPFFAASEKKYEEVLIIGGGPSALIHANALQEFIDKNSSLCIIHASSKNASVFQSSVVKQIFCLVGNEGHRLETVLPDIKNMKAKVVLPPYPRKMGTYVPEALIDKAFELETVSFTDKFEDSHTSLALQSAFVLGAKKIYITGYDGYNKEIITLREQGLFQENEYLFSKVKSKGIKIFSLTPTQYNELEPLSLYSLIS